MECKLENASIYYETRGKGRPLLILHGAPLDHRHMLDAMEPVFEHRRGWMRIYMDLPGHGRSPVDEAVSTQDQVLEIILAFMDEILPGRSCAVAGESRGGYLARGIAHRIPDRVDGLLLIVPGRYLAAAPEDLPAQVTLVRADELRSGLAPDEVGRFDRLVVQSRRILEKIRAYKIPALALADEAFQARVNARYEFSFDVDRPETPFGKPSLILSGRQDAVVGYRDAWKAIECYPRATFAILDTAGHSLAWEQEELFVALASEWLQRVEDFGG